MIKQLLLITGLLLSLSFAVAQETEITGDETYSVLSQEELIDEVGYIPESLDADIDSLLHSWHVRYFTSSVDYCQDDEKNVFFPDSTYRDRLDRLPRVIPMQYNKVVRQCIDLYAERRRGLVRYMLGMADYYFPIIEQVLDEHDLPLELKYLAVVESALNPRALSRVGASGLWQFMLPTGKVYGLTINSLVDERLDPVKSTYAACRYFKDMYAIYNDWNLVMAAYNCGPGNVNKAMKRSGKTDFWDIFPYLPKETRSYVPLFIAANYIMNYYCDHNLCPVETNLPLATDTVVVNKILHFDQVADMLSLDIEQLRVLNPQYKRDIVPGNTGSAVLKLPAAQTYAFVENEDTIFYHGTDSLLADMLNNTTEVKTTRERIVHITKQGENLHVVGNKYGVTAKDIRKWNGLGSNRVAVGKRLVLYVDNGGVAFASNAKANAPAATKKAAAPTTVNTDKGNSDYRSYTVQSGDSLYSISKKYPGVTIALIQSTNNMTGTSLRPGQILKIPVV